MERVVRLPASALATDETVLVIGDGDRLEELQVRLIRRQGDDVLVRGAGLEGREVVVGRTPLLGEGILVRPLRDVENAQPEPPAMLEIGTERRARIITFVEGNHHMPDEAKERGLTALSRPQVPASMVERIESRMGGVGRHSA